LLFAPAALAQDDAARVTAAETAFDAGRQLLKDGRIEEACAKFAASQKLSPAVGTLLNLADCQERAGRTATAWTSFRQCESLARKQDRAEHAKEAQRRAAALSERLSKLTIKVNHAVPGLSVTRGTVVVQPAMFGLPVPVDPGDLLITAEATGHTRWTKTIAMPQGPAELSVEVPSLEKIAVAAPSSPLPVVEQNQAVPAVTPSEPAADVGADDDNAVRTAGLVVGGIGIVAVGVGVAFGVVANSKNDASNDPAQGGCTDANFCTAEGVALRDEAFRSAHVSTAMLAIGAAAAVSGAVMYLLGGGSDAPDEPGTAQTALSLSPRMAVVPLDQHGAVVSVGGAW